MTAPIFRHGDSHLLRGPVLAATVIAVGDLLYLDPADDTLKPAASLAWDTDLATTQGNFAENFAGVAREASAAGDETPVTYDRSPVAVYEYDIAAGAYVLGASMGPAKQTGNALENQKLAAAVAAAAIARVADVDLPATDRVRVTFAPAIVTGSSNAYSTVGA